MKTILKRAVVGLTLSLSMGMANAITINHNFDTFTIGDLTSFSDTGYSNDSTLTKGMFSQTYNFSIPSLSDVGAGASNVYMKVGKKTWDITGLSLTLKDSNHNALTSGIDGWSLAKGNYSFAIAGNATGTQGGKYSFNAVAAPVPEPSSLILMLGGFGLIGFMSSRRRKYL